MAALFQQIERAGPGWAQANRFLDLFIEEVIDVCGYPGGRCRRRSFAWRSTYSESAAARTASSRKNMKGLLHVAVGCCCCLLRTAAVLTRARVWRVPVPPVVRGVRRHLYRAQRLPRGDEIEICHLGTGDLRRADHELMIAKRQFILPESLRLFLLALS